MLGQDPAARQLLVQAALSNGQPGLAAPAALAIASCTANEQRADRMRAALTRMHPAMGDARFRMMWDHIESELRLCQALDASSRAQWLPLMRRGMKEGKLGTAAELVMAFEGTPYEEAAATEALAYLRRDARQCDRLSMWLAHGMSRKQEGRLTVEEAEAFRQLLKKQRDADPDPVLRVLRNYLDESGNPGNPVEVERIVAEISAHC
jgi:hypothetical protein